MSLESSIMRISCARKESCPFRIRSGGMICRTLSASLGSRESFVFRTAESRCELSLLRGPLQVSPCSSEYHVCLRCAYPCVRCDSPRRRLLLSIISAGPPHLASTSIAHFKTSCSTGSFYSSFDRILIASTLKLLGERVPRFPNTVPADKRLGLKPPNWCSSEPASLEFCWFIIKALGS